MQVPATLKLIKKYESPRCPSLLSFFVFKDANEPENEKKAHKTNENGAEKVNATRDYYLQLPT